MKKLVAIILVLALALSFSTVAMAVETNTSVGTATNMTNNGATTVVSIMNSSDGQVSATVPLLVTLAVAADGSVTGPDNYTVTNTSVMPIKVTSVTITPKAGFTTEDGGTGTQIGLIELSDGRNGTATTLRAWAAAKSTTAWNMDATGGTTPSIDLAFGGAVSGITQDITTATAAFDVVYTIAAGAN